MELRLNVTRPAAGLQPGDVVLLHAKVLDNNLARSELTVELVTNTSRHSAIVSYLHVDKTQLAAFYEAEDDDD